MAQILVPEKIGNLSVASTTQVQLAPSIVNVGGLQYANISNLTCTTSTSGFGGIDTGSIAANSLYQLYAVVNAGVLGLVCSLNATAPTGFTASRRLGAFYTNASSQAIQATNIGGILYWEHVDTNDNVVSTPALSTWYNASPNHKIILPPGTYDIMSINAGYTATTTTGGAVVMAFGLGTSTGNVLASEMNTKTYNLSGVLDCVGSATLFLNNYTVASTSSFYTFVKAILWSGSATLSYLHEDNNDGGAGRLSAKMFVR